MELTLRAHMGIGAEFELAVMDHDPGCPADRIACACGGRLAARAHGHNLMTTAGLNLIAAVLAWSAEQDQDANLGHPLLARNLYPLYGAVGTSVTAPAVGDTQLGGESGRAVLASAAIVAGQITFNFFFGLTLAVGTITEAGLFANANATLNNGILLDHGLLSTGVAKSAAQTALLTATLTVSQ